MAGKVTGSDKSLLMDDITVVVIPTNQRRKDLLPPLVNDLLAQHDLDKLLVYDNSPEQDAQDFLPYDSRLEVVGAAGLGIYAMWNAGWRRALELSDGLSVNVAILNDDIVISDKFIRTLARSLRKPESKWWVVYPDYSYKATESTPTGEMRASTGTYQHGGMCGWAFMFRGELALNDGLEESLSMFDERYRWWFGDDHFANLVLLHGGAIGRVVGLGIEHLENGGNSGGFSSEDYVIDLRLFEGIWG